MPRLGRDMLKSADVVVVGKGPAAWLAAGRLLSSGRKVVLVYRSEGTYPMWPGDLSLGNPQKNRKDASIDDTGLGVNEARTLLEEVGIECRQASDGESYFTLTPTGARRPTSVWPAWMYAEREPQDLIIVGMRGLPDSMPYLQARKLKMGKGIEVATCELPAPPGWNRDWGPLRFASFIDTEKGMSWLISQLSTALAGTDPSFHVAIPQVLGLNNTCAILEEIEEQLGREVHEFGTLSPSVGGIRIEQRLGNWFAVNGGRTVQGVVASVEAGPLVRLRDGRTLLTGAVVLATGGIAGGGFEIHPDGSVYDPILDLSIGKVDSLTDFEAVGYRSVGEFAESKIFAVGRSIAGWHPNRDFNGGAMLASTVEQALLMIEETA